MNEPIKTVCPYFIPNNDTGGTGRCIKFNRWCATYLAEIEFDLERKCDFKAVYLGSAVSLCKKNQHE